MDSENPTPLSKHELYLATTFQSKLEEAEYLSNLPSDESHPYDNKYEARKILEKLLVSLEHSSLEKDYQNIAKGIVNFFIGMNFYDTEENHMAEKHLSSSLESFSELPRDKICFFFNYLQELYNTLGTLFANRDDFQEGLAIFAKAEDLYPLMKKVYEKHPISVVHNFRGFTPGETKETFRSYYQGGINIHKCEKNYTLTLFYMAQAYTKANLKFKAAQYCGATLKRQFELKDYEMKDWCVNCISLAEFYNSNMEFAQAQYLLMGGLSIVPEKKRKLCATFYMALGHHLLELLQFSVEKYLSGKTDDISSLNTLNKKTIVFENMNSKFPELKLPQSIEDLNSLFRQCNTQYKKALKYFELDGYVTEYVQIVRDLSKAYRYLSMVEKDQERVLAILDRRRELLEYPATEINPKAFENYWQVRVYLRIS
jgi:KIF-1 binding protein C terminal.